jgi:hypothetical protein
VAWRATGSYYSPPYAGERFVSYSLNFEDVMLRRLFTRYGPGFYVDVGAGHPQFENDTYALYEAGWRGINLEPNETFFCALEEMRPGDRNLCLALSDKAEGELFYHESPALAYRRAIRSRPRFMLGVGTTYACAVCRSPLSRVCWKRPAPPRLICSRWTWRDWKSKYWPATIGSDSALEWCWSKPGEPGAATLGGESLSRDTWLSPCLL